MNCWEERVGTIAVSRCLMASRRESLILALGKGGDGNTDGFTLALFHTRYPMTVFVSLRRKEWDKVKFLSERERVFFAV